MINVICRSFFYSNNYAYRFNSFEVTVYRINVYHKYFVHLLQDISSFKKKNGINDKCYFEAVVKIVKNNWRILLQ